MEEKGMTGDAADKGFDLVKFADLERRFPFEWPGLQADTMIWCVHCERRFPFIEAKLDDEGLLMCAHFPECDGSALDFMPDEEVRAYLSKGQYGEPSPDVSEGA
jgi:hypothetical protein